MTPTLFDRAFAFVVSPSIEGGYVNDPKDPGGETKYGISKRAYPQLNIRDLTPEGARAIYLKDYWTPAGCAGQPWALALAAFDCAVNQGVSVARLFLTEALDTPRSPTEALDALLALREARYRANKNFPIYGKGWLNRLRLVRQEALKP